MVLLLKDVILYIYFLYIFVLKINNLSKLIVIKKKKLYIVYQLKLINDLINLIHIKFKLF